MRTVRWSLESILNRPLRVTNHLLLVRIHFQKESPLSEDVGELYSGFIPAMIFLSCSMALRREFFALQPLSFNNKSNS